MKTNLIEVKNVLDNLTIDNNIYTVLRVYDVEEFNENTAERKAYANIRENDTNRSVIKLWGHKSFVTVEISKTLRKRKEYNVSKKIYTEKTLDKNNNYICTTTAQAVALCKDFLAQCEKLQNSTTATEQTATDEKAN